MGWPQPELPCRSKVRASLQPAELRPPPFTAATTAAAWRPADHQHIVRRRLEAQARFLAEIAPFTQAADFLDLQALDLAICRLARSTSPSA